MLIKNYNLPNNVWAHVWVDREPDVFAAGTVVPLGISTPCLLIWRNAIDSRVIRQGMQRPTWPLQILEALPPEKRWPWEVRQAGREDAITDPSMIRNLACSAAGILHAPHGNITLSLSLRSYEEKTSPIGSYVWWREQRERMNLHSLFIRGLFTGFGKVLIAVGRLGFDFRIEQIAMVIAKDDKVSIATLTPTLHSDMYYSFRETALCSFAEQAYDRHQGTLFVPTMRMDALEEHRPITMEKMHTLFAEIPVIEAGSGDVVLYDGMIGKDGNTSTANGIPHISPDMPGCSSRLLVLMRNLRVPMQT